MYKGYSHHLIVESKEVPFKDAPLDKQVESIRSSVRAINYSISSSRLDLHEFLDAWRQSLESPDEDPKAWISQFLSQNHGTSQLSQSARES